MKWFDRIFKPWRPKCSVHNFDEPIAIRLYDGRAVKFYIVRSDVHIADRTITIELQDCKSLDRMYKL